MALDLEQIAVQIEGMAHNIRLREKDGIAKLGLALDVMQSPVVERESLNQKIILLVVLKIQAEPLIFL